MESKSFDRELEKGKRNYYKPVFQVIKGSWTNWIPNFLYLKLVELLNIRSIFDNLASSFIVQKKFDRRYEYS